MKKILTLVFLLTIIATLNAYSQKVRLNGYALYTFDDGVETTDSYNYFNGTIKANLLWGAGLEYNATRDYGIELSYYRQDTDFPVVLHSGSLGRSIDTTFQIAFNYILLGGTRYLLIPRSPIEPFFGAMLGIAIIDNKHPLPNGSSSETEFAWGVKAGMDIMASPQFGIKLQAQLLSVPSAFNADYYYMGYGSSYSTMLQFGIGGGLTFRFGR